MDNPTTHAEKSITSPPLGIVAITLDAPISPPIRGFEVTGQGAVAAVYYDGSTGTRPMCAPGSTYSGLITKILSSGTTATGIVGLR